METRFMVDAMLGSFARKLRAAGFNTAYYREGDDEGLLDEAAKEGRVVLTSDRALETVALKRGVEVLLITGGTDAARVLSLAEGAKRSGVVLSWGDPFCSVCGGALRRMSRDEAALVLPPQVVSSHRAFSSCLSCGKVYWKGSHWKKLRSLSLRLRQTYADIR